MDLEGFVRKAIRDGSGEKEILEELRTRISSFKSWDENKVDRFARALLSEIETSLKYQDDDLIKDVLEAPVTAVSMGSFGVGSRGKGDFRVHRDIARITGYGALVGPMEQDDAGVTRIREGFLAVAIDGIHSRLSEYPFLAAFHAARAAMRDVAVMGAMPVGVFTDLHLADDGDVGRLYDFTAGVSTAAEAADIPVLAGSTLRVGGDMVFGERLVAGVGAAGFSTSPPLERKKAEAGDAILLTLGKGGGTISTTAIYNGAFEVVKETLNMDFTGTVKKILEKGLEGLIHTLVDVTNGGLRGDAHEISRSSGTRLVLYEEEVKRSISPPLLRLLEDQEIDPLGVSTDSLMVILPPHNVERVKSAMEEVGPVFEAGRVVKGQGAGLISAGSESELEPLFREAPYTKIKKVVGTRQPSDFDALAKILERAATQSIEKKKRILNWMGGI